ncbi:MAG TPA: hypothetical protein VLK03_06205 [Nocardioides sp.]|nr:hypothetical protein [Nocardioides sp.]
MKKHTADSLIDVALRSLDPAPATVQSQDERVRAEAAFARIVAGPAGAPDTVEPRPPRRARRRLLVSVGLVGAAGAAVPALLLGGGSAFGSWTPTPEPLTPADVGQALAACRAVLAVPDRGERAVVAERRGGWTYVLVAGPRAEGACLMPDDLVGQEDPAAHRSLGFFGSYSTDPAEAPSVARNGIAVTGAMEGSVPRPSIWPFGDDDGWFSLVEGYVGAGVTGVTVHTPVGVDVEASVTHGRFAAWWPSEQPSSDNLQVMGPWTYTVTLADGGTRRVAG